MPSPNRLIVGLGNPGGEYAATRHNIGFMALDQIASKNNFPSWKNKFNGQITGGSLGNDVLLLKPETFMNLSGESVGEAMRFYKLIPDMVVVIHDEIDLPPGEIRVKKGGSHAGHNGLKSIDAHIGQDYHRVRIGVGHPGNRDLVSGHVLGRISQEDAALISPALETFVDGFADFLGKL